MHFMFYKGQGKEQEYFWGFVKISNIVLGMLDIPNIFGVNSRCWVKAYV